MVTDNGPDSPQIATLTGLGLQTSSVRAQYPLRWRL